MDDGGHRCGFIVVLSGSIRIGAFDRTEARGACGWHSGARTEEHGVCDMDGIHVPEPCDRFGWRILFGVAQFGEFVAVVSHTEITENTEIIHVTSIL